MPSFISFPTAQAVLPFRNTEIQKVLYTFSAPLARREKAFFGKFHTSAKKLTLQQSALITACYPNPLKRNPSKPTAYLNKRAGQISSLTHKLGKIKFDDETIAKAHQRYEKRNAERKAKKERKRHTLKTPKE